MPAASIGVDFVANTARWTPDIERAKNILKSNEAQMNASLSRIDGGFGRVGKSAGQMRSGFNQLSFQINDVAAQMANGTKASVIFAQQSGQVIQAIQLMSGGSSRFASFMGGPWGIAISVGVSALSALWSMMGNAEKAAKDAQKQHESFADSLDRTKHSYDEVVAAVKEYNTVQGKAREMTLLNAAAAAKAANDNIAEAMSIRERLAARLAEAQASQTGNVGGGLPGTATFIGGEVEKVKAQIAENDAKLRSLAADAAGAVIGVAEQIAAIQSDSSAQLKAGFDLRRKNARETIKDVRALAAELTKLNQQEKAALDAISASKRSAGLTASDVGGFLKGQFGGSFSGTRTAARNKEVGGAAHSFHLTGQAVDFVPRGGVNSISKADIRAALEAKGVAIKELLGPGDKGHSDHFHIAFSKTQRDAEQIAARANTAAEKAEREREEAIRRQAAFADASSNLDRSLLEARRAATTDASALAQIARDEVRVASERFTADIEAKVKTQDLTRAQATELEIKDAILASTKLQQINIEEAARKAQDILSVTLAANDNEREILQAQDSLATTQSERRQIQERILKMDKDEERIRLQGIIDLAKIGKATAAEAQAAQDRLGKLDQIYAARGQEVNNRTAGPMESYLKFLNMNAAQINEAFQSIEVEGLQSLNDGIFDAITGAKSLGDAFKNVANSIISDLIRIAIQQAVVRPLANALGSILHISGAALGASTGGGTGGVRIPGFADGTNFAPGGLALVGERGPEMVRLPRGSQVIPNHMLNGGGGQSVNLTVNAPGATAETVMLIRRELANAAPTIAAAASNMTTRNLSRQRL